MFIATDQSDTDTHFVVASYWLPLDCVQNFEQRVLALRLNQKYWREAHFASLKKKERAFDFMQSLLEIASAEELTPRFAVVIAANDKNMAKRYFGGSIIQRDTVFMYELLSRRYRWWKIPSDPYVIFDDITHHETAKTSSDEPEDNVDDSHTHQAREHFEKFIAKKVQCFSPCRSHTSSAIQVADVIAGMTSLRRRIDKGLFKKKESPNPAKIELLEWFEKNIGINLGVPTLPSRERFNIWKHNSLQSN